MSVGDITVLEQGVYTGRGARRYNVAAGATVINPGEPVVRVLGAVTVTAMATNKPVVATDYVVGIAATTSTQTTAVAGFVYVHPISSAITYLAKPNDTTAYDTQAEYDALVGKRVLFDLTSGAYTILASDGATSGCVIQALDIAKYPGRVAFAFRAALSDLA